jgi:hypothetical protein
MQRGFPHLRMRRRALAPIVSAVTLPEGTDGGLVAFVERPLANAFRGDEAGAGERLGDCSGKSSSVTSIRSTLTSSVDVLRC